MAAVLKYISNGLDFISSAKCVTTAVWRTRLFFFLVNVIDGLTGSCKWKWSLILWDHQSSWHRFTFSFIMNTAAIFPSCVLVWFRKQHPVCVDTLLPGQVSKTSLFFFFSLSLYLRPLSSLALGRGGYIINTLALTVSVNTANSILKCVRLSHKPPRVPPFYFLTAPSLLICHGKRCVGWGQAWTLG